jgi:hypothetical protein
VSNEEDEFRKCRWSCKNLAIKTKLHDLKWLICFQKLNI